MKSWSNKLVYRPVQSHGDNNGAEERAKRRRVDKNKRGRNAEKDQCKRETRKRR